MPEIAILLDVRFKSLPPILISTSQYDVILDNKKFISTGDVIDIAKSKVSRGIQTTSTKITFAGEVSEYVKAINLNTYIGGYIKVYVATIGDSGAIVDSFIVINGIMNKPVITRTLTNVKTTIDIIPKMILFDRAVGTFPVDTLQQSLSPGDTIFSLANEAAAKAEASK